MTLAAPFPYFGGKSRVADAVWERLGSPARYIEPFAGSLAVLLARPRPFSGREIVNDKDGLLVNFWRAMVHDADAVAEWADWPPTESDLHARHAWLVGQRDSLTAQLEGDPEFYDPKAAGWWVWGIGLWIGSSWCSGDGPWRVFDTDEGRKLLHAGSDGQGIHRKLLHAGSDGQGIHRKLLHAGNDGQGTARIVGWRRDTILSVLAPLQERLRDVMVMAGDWTRVVSPAVMFGSGRGRAVQDGACAIFLDPPYPHDQHSGAVYAQDDARRLAHDVREWALKHGADPRLRIALCGYEGQWQMPDDWHEVAWSTKGGYASQGSGVNLNKRRERVWFSPYCHVTTLGLTA
jgi:hypothetical protein